MLARFVCTIALLLPVVAFAQETVPPKLGPNLLANSDFENGAENDVPKNWKFSSAMPQIFQSKIVADDKKNHALEPTALAPQMSGYWEQSAPISVKPNTKYLARARAKVERGTLMFWILGAKYMDDNKPATAAESRFYLESIVGLLLASNYWKPESDVWRFANSRAKRVCAERFDACAAA